MCVFVCSLSLARIQGRMVFWGLELWDRPMTVCVCVCSTKRCRGWCAFGKAYVRVCTGVHVCESAYVHMSLSAHYTWLFFPRSSAMLYFE